MDKAQPWPGAVAHFRRAGAFGMGTKNERRSPNPAGGSVRLAGGGVCSGVAKPGRAGDEALGGGGIGNKNIREEILVPEVV